MNKVTSNNAAKQDFMPLMRELVRTYQAFTSYDAQLHRDLKTGLTVSQADVIFTLGNTHGLTCSEVGEKPLITKATITGVIDRLVDKGLVQRRKGIEDARCIRLNLTPKGVVVFENSFPLHVTALKDRFDRITPETKKIAIEALAEIRSVF